MHRAFEGDHDRASGAAALFSADTPVDEALVTLDLDHVRRILADLMEAAAAALPRTGYDFDDVIVARFLHCSTADGRHREVEAVWLADRDRLAAEICAALHSEPEAVRIDRAGVRVWLDRGSVRGVGPSDPC